MWSHGQYVDIIDLKKKKEENSFLCYDYWMSPSGRYMAFTTWHPRMDMIRQYLLAVHDFYEDSLTTPLANKDKPNPAHACGWVVFPEENVRKKSGDVTLTKGFTILSPVKWEENESSIFFHILDIDSQESHPVAVDLKGGINNPVIIRK